MRLDGIVTARQRHQHLSAPRTGSAADLVAWMGAVQAQEYEPARWGLGLRLAQRPGASAIEAEIASGAILRTHMMRPTWHFVAAEDIGWVQALTGPHVQRRMATYLRYFELDPKTLTRALSSIERALGDGGCLTRAEIARALQRTRITASHQKLAHIVMHAELHGLICSGPRRERQFTYALVAERTARVRRRRPLERDEALAELTKRFLQSHGPATVRDFVWWSGLATADAKRGLQIIRAQSMTAEGLVYWSGSDAGAHAGKSRRRPSEPAAHLLPIYDEYLVAYRDRVAVSHGPSLIKERQRSVIFQHAILIDGHVAGTWRTGGSTKSPVLVPMRRLSAAERSAVDDALDRYRRFVAS